MCHWIWYSATPRRRSPADLYLSRLAAWARCEIQSTGLSKSHILLASGADCAGSRCSAGSLRSSIVSYAEYAPGWRAEFAVSTIDAFSALHREGIFVMPNPWDRGSALLLEQMGFLALATTSAGLGRSLGKDDQQVTRDELVTHVADLARVLSVPLNVDSERLYPDDPGGIAETVGMLVDAGAAGCSIEDYDPATGSIVDVSAATDAVAEAARACASSGIVLTARAENHLYGVEDLNDTIERLAAYRDAGADVVYAPGLVTAEDIQRVVSETAAPVNVLALPFGPTVDELGAVGVRRVSAGSALFNAARRTLRDAARELLDDGTSNYAV